MKPLSFSVSNCVSLYTPNSVHQWKSMFENDIDALDSNSRHPHYITGMPIQILVKLKFQVSVTDFLFASIFVSSKCIKCSQCHYNVNIYAYIYIYCDSTVIPCSVHTVIVQMSTSYSLFLVNEIA